MHTVRAILIVYTESLVLSVWRMRVTHRHPHDKDKGMVTVTFAPAIRRHVCVDAQSVDARTVRDALAQCVALTPELRGYLFNDQGRLRAHVAVFVDGWLIRDRRALSDPLNDASRVFVAQALSGG
jgi:hypothetical protein